MYLRNLVTLRKFSTSRILRDSLISPSYKSKQLWEQRFKCRMLTNEELIKPINNKIITGDALSNLELDVFINIATPKPGEIAQLRESVQSLQRFRRSLYAHTLLPSSHHAICRLFLYSNQLKSLITLLENRIDYGVFPDFVALNLLLDDAIDSQDFQSAARVVSLVMLQEEFGTNVITDTLSLYSLAKLVESKFDFNSWKMKDFRPYDPIFGGQNEKFENEQAEAEKEEAGDDEEEDDAEYIRIPFLRNPYNDNHFDLREPRILCAKALVMLGKNYATKDIKLSLRSLYLGCCLQGDLVQANQALLKLKEANDIDIGSLKELSEFHLADLPDDEQKQTLSKNLQSFTSIGHGLSELAKCNDLKEAENQDIKQFETNLVEEWPKLRQEFVRRQEEKVARENLIAEIRAKKEELKLKEQYLYFYDNLKKSRLTRIEYE